MSPPLTLRPLGLLSSFPSPPTHIPSSPNGNPPPSGPPTSPLPPLPDGPSPVTPAEQIAFIALRRTSHASTSSQISSRTRSSHSSSNSDSPSPAQDHPVRSALSSSQLDDRASSPDIAVLIQRTSTPRSALSSASSQRSSRSKRRSHSSTSQSIHSSAPIKRLRSTPALGASTAATTFYPPTRPDAPPFPPSLSSEPLHQRTPSDLDSQEEADWLNPDPADTPEPWEQVWEDEVPSEEDPLIDLQTSLPHLMLRAGLLSPHSKLLPRPSPSPEPNPRPPPTKRKPLRDDRDTEKRRQRHKDGKLLRGGIGLTTGLGWSDSEDEDAPSALTHRLSRLAPSLSRKSSAASSLASSPFTRSPSRSTSRSTTFSGTSSPSVTSFSRSSAKYRGSALVRSASASTLGEPEEPPSSLPYLSPVESVREEGQDVEIHVPEYPYSFEPTTPTEHGHGEEAREEAACPWDRGHGEGTARSWEHGLTPHALISPPPQVTGPTIWRPSRSPLFDAVDPFARQYSAPAPTPGDRSPTPTSRTASTASLPMPSTPHHEDVEDAYPKTGLRYPRPGPRKASLPVLQQGSEYGASGSRPVSKALPPLPTNTSRTSGIPKTSSMSSLRSVASAQRHAIPVSAFSQSMRERATSTASLQSLRSMRSGSSGSAQSVMSAVSVRPGLPTPRANIPPPTRIRTTSTSSASTAASIKPLKSAIKPASYRSGMVAPKPSFPSLAGQTGIAI